jgi:predicted DNA-binding transcriptional regulator AlpA
MLSQEKLNNIHKLKSEEILQIFHECEEYLGLVDMEESEKILGISKRRVYQLMNQNNSIEIGKHKFPCINLFKFNQ